MKQSEKLDLILRELYKFKNDGSYHSMQKICYDLNIPLDSFVELNRLAHILKDDSFINVLFTHGDCNAEITGPGIEYCEEDSYAFDGNSIMKNTYSISIVNSPNSNIVSQSNEVSISQEINEATQVIDKIREAIAVDESISEDKLSEILECLNEIQESLNNNKKPKFAIKYLLKVADGISSISEWVLLLSELIKS